jgi:hypothetical protein
MADGPKDQQSDFFLTRSFRSKDGSRQPCAPGNWKNGSGTLDDKIAMPP